MKGCGDSDADCGTCRAGLSDHHLCSASGEPVREWLLGTEALREGQRCLLRSEIVRIYYRHVKDKQLQEYEFRNLVQCYNAYKALGGNSFVDHIYEEMQDWEII